MALITSLPTELKNMIACMVAAQDAAFWQRQELNMFREDALEIVTGWHGRGIRALFQVSREWYKLSKPFVYETLRASSASSHFLAHHVVNRRGSPNTTTHTRTS